MIISMSLLEDGVMTDFNDICNAYAAYEDAAYRYWDDLRDKAVKIAFGLEAYLGLSGVTYEEPGKSPEHHVKVGVIENGAFKKGNQLSFEKKELSLRFAISLTLPRVFPELNLALPLEISLKNHTYSVAVSINNGASSVVRIPSGFDVEAQNQLYELIARSVVDMFDTAVFQ